MTNPLPFTDAGFSDRALAEKIGVSREAVRLWRLGQRQMRPGHARAIAKLTGIPLHELRPDLWDAPAVSDAPGGLQEAA